MSEADIDKGTRWSAELALQLNETRLGLICLTPENLEAPWILFEAGALSKTLTNTFVCPYLFGIEPANIIGPLAQFQLTRAQKEDTRNLLSTINRSLDVLALPEKQLDEIFDVWWPYMESQLASIPAPREKPKPQRLERDILEEVLETIRELARGLPLSSPSEIPFFRSIALTPTFTSVEGADSLSRELEFFESSIYRVEREMHQSGVIPTKARQALSKINSIARGFLNLLTIMAYNNSNLDVTILEGFLQRIRAIEYKTQQLLETK